MAAQSGPGRPDDDPSRWALSRLLSTAARYVEHAFAEHLAAHDITHAGFVALALLQRGDATIGDLARRSGVEDQTMTRIVDRLERTGHVQRRRDPGDRRRVMVALTDDGRESFRAATRDDPMTEVATALGDEALLRAELARIVTVMSARRIPGAEAAGMFDPEPAPRRRRR